MHYAQDYALEGRRFLMEQLRYDRTQNDGTEKIVGGKRMAVRADWLNTTEIDFTGVTQVLIDAGLLTRAPAASMLPSSRRS
jgi:hypothetical protein